MAGPRTPEVGPTVLRVNGEDLTTFAPKSTPLIHVLRDELGLTATRFGCGAEQCGACVVLLDGKPAYSCTVTVAEAGEAPIATVEGLARDGVPNALQRAFIDEQAAQCGYCVPGILMRATWLLSQDAAPDERAVRAALDPHLCRCGAHNRIVRAVLRAAARLRGGGE